MPRTMSLAASQARAERAYYLREVGMQSWGKIRDELGFSSVGAAQNAYNRHAKRNPLPRADTVKAAIVERKRTTLGIAFKALSEASRSGDHQAVARLIDTITRIDGDLAKLHGLNHETVDITVTQTSTAIIADARERLLAVIDGEVTSTPTKGIEQ